MVPTKTIKIVLHPLRGFTVNAGSNDTAVVFGIGPRVIKNETLAKATEDLETLIKTGALESENTVCDFVVTGLGPVPVMFTSTTLEMYDIMLTLYSEVKAITKSIFLMLDIDCMLKDIIKRTKSTPEAQNKENNEMKQSTKGTLSIKFTDEKVSRTHMANGIVCFEIPAYELTEDQLMHQLYILKGLKFASINVESGGYSVGCTVDFMGEAVIDTIVHLATGNRMRYIMEIKEVLEYFTKALSPKQEPTSVPEKLVINIDAPEQGSIITGYAVYINLPSHGTDIYALLNHIKELDGQTFGTLAVNSVKHGPMFRHSVEFGTDVLIKFLPRLVFAWHQGEILDISTEFLKLACPDEHVGDAEPSWDKCTDLDITLTGNKGVSFKYSGHGVLNIDIGSYLESSDVYDIATNLKLLCDAFSVIKIRVVTVNQADDAITTLCDMSSGAVADKLSGIVSTIYNGSIVTIGDAAALLSPVKTKADEPISSMSNGQPGITVELPKQPIERPITVVTGTELGNTDYINGGRLSHDFDGDELASGLLKLRDETLTGNKEQPAPKDDKSTLTRYIETVLWSAIEAIPGKLHDDLVMRLGKVEGLKAPCCYRKARVIYKQRTLVGKIDTIISVTRELKGEVDSPELDVLFRLASTLASPF